MSVRIESHEEEFLEALEMARTRALIRIGFQAEGYAVDLAPVDTGLLRNSITFALSGESPQKNNYKSKKGDKSGSYSGKAPAGENGKETVYIGTNVEYAAYVELGTGAKNTPGGRPDPWGYIDDDGNAHHTGGQKAQPFLGPAVSGHKDTYRNIIIDEYKNIPNEF